MSFINHKARNQFKSSMVNLDDKFHSTNNIINVKNNLLLLLLSTDVIRGMKKDIEFYLGRIRGLGTVEHEN